MLGTLLCLAAMAQAQCPDGDCTWQATTTPSGAKAGWIQEPYGKRLLKEVAECPAYLKAKPPTNLPPGQWRLLLDSANKASWRRWKDGLEDVVYPQALAGTIFPDQHALTLYVRSRPDLKPPVQPTDQLLGMFRGVDLDTLNKERGGGLYASKVGLEPDDPPILGGGQISAEIVFGACAIVIAIGCVWILLHFKKQEGD